MISGTRCARHSSHRCCTACACWCSRIDRSRSLGRSPVPPNVSCAMPAAPLLDLRVTHPFYADFRCGDLMIAPSAATEQLMRRLRLTCKAFPDHVSLYAELTPTGGAFAAAAAPVSLDFMLRPR